MNELLEIISSDTELKRTARTNGGEWHGPCPKCGGDDRFIAWPEQEPHGRFWCRRCDISGDDVDYLVIVQGMTKHEALKVLRPDNGQRPRKTRSASARSTPLLEEVKETTKPPEQWIKQARDLCNDATRRLWTDAGKEGLEYLRRRGLEDETIKAAGLGYIERDDWKRPEVWGLVDKKIYIPGPSIVIPKTVDGNIHSVKFRRLSSGYPKYIQISESQTVLYGMDDVQDFRYMVLTEGEFDALLLRQEAGDLAAIATLGSASIDDFPHHALPALLKLTKVFIAYDGDISGTKGSIKLRSRYRGLMQILAKPGPGDLTDFHLAGGSLKAWLLDELADLSIYDNERAAIRQFDGGVSEDDIEAEMNAVLRRG